MFELLVFGTFWFWVVCCVGAIIVTHFMYEEELFKAFISILSITILCYFFGHGAYWAIISYAMANPMSLLGWIILYFVVGTIWCFIKWYFFLLDSRDNGAGKAPLVEIYRDKIIGWMCYWPLSVLLSILQRMSNYIFKDVKDK